MIALQRQRRAHIRFERIVIALRHGSMMAYSPFILR
jgi:hypothetical protein